MDIPRIFNISESAHRIHNPFTPDKFATLGTALRLMPGARVLDLGSGSGEMLCTWARDHGIVGTGIDMSQLFSEQAKLRAEELGVADQVKFIHGDAAGYVSNEKVDVAACVGATWIAGGVAGTTELLARSLRTGGIILIGEPYWRQLPATEDIAKRCLANSVSDFLVLPELVSFFGNLGYDVVEMVLANQDGWDRYEAAKWLTMRRWLEANPDDELAKVRWTRTSPSLLSGHAQWFTIARSNARRNATCLAPRALNTPVFRALVFGADFRGTFVNASTDLGNRAVLNDQLVGKLAEELARLNRIAKNTFFYTFVICVGGFL